MNTFTDEDLTILDALDFLPPCEHSGHERNGSGPAAWALLMSPVLECGCPAPTVVLWCDPCKSHILSLDTASCNACRARLVPSHNVLRIESLR